MSKNQRKIKSWKKLANEYLFYTTYDTWIIACWFTLDLKGKVVELLELEIEGPKVGSSAKMTKFCFNEGNEQKIVSNEAK